MIQSTGKPITAGLLKENPYRLNQCPYVDQCKTDPNQDCSTTNLTYELSCEQCERDGRNDTKHIYIGCSGKSNHARCLEHQKDVRNRDESNSMAKHFAKYHNNNPGNFTSRVKARHKGCLRRFIDESIRIENGEMSFGLANSKSEWGAGRLVRMTNERT